MLLDQYFASFLSFSAIKSKQNQGSKKKKFTNIEAKYKSLENDCKLVFALISYCINIQVLFFRVDFIDYKSFGIITHELK